MTASITFEQTIITIKKQWVENTRLFVLMLLIGLLVFFFAFWSPAAAGAHYQQPAVKGTEVTSSPKIGRADAAQLYENVVRNGDAVRSVLQ